MTGDATTTSASDEERRICQKALAEERATLERIGAKRTTEADRARVRWLSERIEALS